MNPITFAAGECVAAGRPCLLGPPPPCQAPLLHRWNVHLHEWITLHFRDATAIPFEGRCRRDSVRDMLHAGVSTLLSTCCKAMAFLLCIKGLRQGTQQTLLQRPATDRGCLDLMLCPNASWHCNCSSSMDSLQPAHLIPVQTGRPVVRQLVVNAAASSQPLDLQ